VKHECVVRSVVVLVGKLDLLFECGYAGVPVVDTVQDALLVSGDHVHLAAEQVLVVSHLFSLFLLPLDVPEIPLRPAVVPEHL